MEMARKVRRIQNGFKKLAAGLTLFGENISPEVPNDLYFAHLSIYEFFATFSCQKRVLDVGCGCGYGSSYLRDRGASSVVGIDTDAKAIRYANKRFTRSGLSFLNRPAERVGTDLGVFDVIVASNLMEHLLDVDAVLDRLPVMMAAEGTVVVAVPPIIDERSLLANQAIPYHRSNLYVWEWIAKLEQRFSSVRSVKHVVVPGVIPDFTNPFPSTLRVNDFAFVESTPEQLAREFTLTAILVATGVKGLVSAT